jgi:hypothetical protein
MIGDGDVAALISSGDFDVPVVFTKAAGGTVTTTGIFTDATQQTNILTQEVETVNAMLDCDSSAISAVKRGDTVLVNSVTYGVERLQKLGTGFTTVHLKSP